jgi:CelD/BcsL family acetyltransferase involved in cellulose biosynthesis
VLVDERATLREVRPPPTVGDNTSGEHLTAYLGFHSAGGLHLSKTSFDPELSKYGPGRVCRLLLVQHAFENGVGFLDLMSGSFAWKMSMSSRQTPCTNYRVPGRLFT